MADYYYERQKRIEAYKYKSSPATDFPPAWPIRYESGKWFLDGKELPKDHFGGKDQNDYFVLSEADFDDKYKSKEYD